ncbi:uncharacterized protein PV09_05153 [Verruconis gallopava]|uniref:Uncharacterized protein n=1 Tax=Verruconis gallopava TaxID=253628 RepID=A0A0D2AXE1_9PEZI|nr:uncharacterized protein PV09_05153 [Verruconis gallopava]KIW03854.1 hypothetical protein PV09_05153 [Verruconis gallopava]
MPLPEDPLNGILELILEQWRTQIARLHALEGKLSTYARELEGLIKKLIDEGTDQTLQLRDDIEKASHNLRTIAGAQREVAERFIMPDSLLKTIDFFYPQLGIPEMKQRIRERLKNDRDEAEALRSFVKREAEDAAESGGEDEGDEDEGQEEAEASKGVKLRAAPGRSKKRRGAGNDEG